MNERIRQLMLEAGYAAPEIAGRAQRLAELIVRDCANAADMAHAARCDYPGDYIVEHFGLDVDGAATWRTVNE